jgi:predicted nucleic acid-binding protein
MTRFVVGARAALRLAAERFEVPSHHELLAPTLLRSQALSLQHEAVRHGELDGAEAREQLAHLTRMRIRLLGDEVMRRRAWEIADRLGWDETYDAEYVALTELQADALITLNGRLARSLDGVVTVATLADLRT